MKFRDLDDKDSSATKKKSATATARQSIFWVTSSETGFCFPLLTNRRGVEWKCVCVCVWWAWDCAAHTVASVKSSESFIIRVLQKWAYSAIWLQRRTQFCGDPVVTNRREAVGPPWHAWRMGSHENAAGPLSETFWSPLRVPPINDALPITTWPLDAREIRL